MYVIEIEDLVVRYGSATALDGVSLTVAAGEMVALVGPNGAGKSTLLKTLSGVLQPAAGRVAVHGRLAHVPEGRLMFPDLTVDDNLRLGAFQLRERDTAWIYEIMPELLRTRTQRAGTLSGGQQQMVALGRGLMAKPDVLVIDEMSLGLAPLVVQGLARTLADLNVKRRLAMLVVEQNSRLAFSLCERAYVLESGKIVAHGPTRELAEDPRVKSVYLGESSEASP
jgi:branched-chain amino acid transport system ATP-binding protein